ncbi:MAG: peptidoglycan recognition family protein [Actinomycetota bacterium]
MNASPGPARSAVLLVALALALTPATSAAESPQVSSSSEVSAPTPRVAQPDIRWRRISFGPKRKRQTAGYARRHYGLNTWRLQNPRVIVEHFTASTTLASAWWTFEGNSTYNGEKPGVCAHFIIDTDGTIFQLVDLGTMCRHAVGMNWTAIGIEMVGTSDRKIMRRERQYEAAQWLTLWLMERYGIDLGDVIGHSETLNSPFHRERVASWRCLTHGDWSHAHMKVFRDDLTDLARQEGVDLGSRVHREPSNCG